MGHKTLLPAKTLYPRSMMRPEEVSNIVTFTSEQKVTYTQILTNQWEELEHSLYGSVTSNITIKKIEATSQGIRRTANLPEPREKARSHSAQSVQITRISHPNFKNHAMSSRKRVCRVEHEVQSVAPESSSSKRAKTTVADTPVKTFRKIKRLCTYDHVLAVWSQPMTQKQNSFLRNQMKVMMRQKSVTDLNTFWKVAPESETTKKPMLQLSTIENNLKAGGYSSVSDLCKDFEVMVTDVHLICGESGLTSTAARRLYRSFCARVMYCPTGPGGKSASDCGREAIKLMESRITNVTTRATTPSSGEIEVISIDSDEDELDKTAIEAEGDEYEESYEDLDVSEDETAVPCYPTIPLESHERLLPPESAKISGANDDMDDEESRQLQKEIEERQQKLANIARKKTLVAKIRNLNTEKLALSGKKVEIEKQCSLLHSEHEERCAELKAHISAFEQDSVRCREEFKRLNREHERLRQEIRRNQQCRKELRPRFAGYQENLSRLQSEQNEHKEKKQQLEIKYEAFEDSLEQLEDRRTDAEEELQSLINGNI
ncbi:hypothetical protein QM012_008270 [Aureobasidium pullulans]|uniref:Uncharacterized protein n=1 Tax=Aureobasidium pullulans TaxID=5580 RepID=A0ABR0TIY3_AURPU